MRNPQNVLESLKSKACNKNYTYKRLYRNLYNQELYLEAYDHIYSKEGNMTKGTDGKTIDGTSLARIDKLIESLRNYSYHPQPARRVYIPKKNNPSKMRPLGIPSFEDKLLQEVIRMLLASIYEDTFSPHSHGFRPNRSCHTALTEIKRTFTGTTWFVEGDIKGCFDNVDHTVLVNILRRRIKDEYFIGLIWKFLKAGYMEDWKYHETYSGTPQGSLISPILANIYLHELDTFMESLVEEFNTGRKRRQAFPYRKLAGKLQYLKEIKYGSSKWASMSEEQRKNALAEMQSIRAEMLKIPAGDPMDATFKKVRYVRYADDFLIGVIGSKKDAEDIRDKVGNLLGEKLHLELSKEKTLTTHAKNDKARFLGYDIFVCNDQNPRENVNGTVKRSRNNLIMLYVPKEKWMNKLLEYKALKINCNASTNFKEVWEPIHRKDLLHLDDLEILRQYNAEVRGMYNYYRIAENVTVLDAFGYVMKYSMYKTFAAKYNSTISKMVKKFRIGKDFGIRYETKSGTKTAVFYNEGFRFRPEIADVLADKLPHLTYEHAKTSLISRLKAKTCEWCGAEGVDLEIHHVRRLKDLKGKKKWEQLMISRKRKTLALCVKCHDLLHAGKMD